MGDPDEKLSIEIKNVQPVELADLSRALQGFADEYRHFLEQTDPVALAEDIRLYVKEIRTGSIVTELVPYAVAALPLISQVNTVVSFAKHLKTAYDYLTGKSDDKPKDLDRASYQHLSDIVDPVAKDRGSQVNIGTLHGNVVISMNSVDANAAQNRARKEIEALREPESLLHEKVLLYWYQARADASSKAGDRGIIESISKRPVKVVCSSDRIKSDMVLDESNPFKFAYVVDVLVETIGGKPALYKIVSMHDKFERES